MEQDVSNETYSHKTESRHSKEKLKHAAESVGQFIEYRGFRSIHGRIWTVVFLSPRPVSTLEIIQKLEVSKGLVSKAVGELLDYGLIQCSGNTVYARRTYIACEDVGSIVGSVLKDREMTLLRKNVDSLSTLSSCDHDELNQIGVEPKKLELLCQLTKENENLLHAFLRKKFKTLPEWIKFTKRARGFLKL